jgi:hypothetical protein
MHFLLGKITSYKGPRDSNEAVGTYKRGDAIMLNEFVDYLTRDVRPFMDLLSFKGQLVDPMAFNDNAVNDNTAKIADIVPPKAAA